MTEPTELYITKDPTQKLYDPINNTLSFDIGDFLARVDGIMQPYNVMIETLSSDIKTLIELRSCHLKAVAAIEKKIGILPTTSMCRKIARGKAE